MYVYFWLVKGGWRGGGRRERVAWPANLVDTEMDVAAGAGAGAGADRDGMDMLRLHPASSIYCRFLNSIAVCFSITYCTQWVDDSA